MSVHVLEQNWFQPHLHFSEAKFLWVQKPTPAQVTSSIILIPPWQGLSQAQTELRPHLSANIWATDSLAKAFVEMIVKVCVLGPHCDFFADMEVLETNFSYLLLDLLFLSAQECRNFFRLFSCNIMYTGPQKLSISSCNSYFSLSLLLDMYSWCLVPYHTSWISLLPQTAAWELLTHHPQPPTEVKSM